MDGKVLDINVVGAISGNLVVDHENSQHVVLINKCRGCLLETKFSENCMEVTSLLGCGNGSDEFGFSGTGSCDGLGFGVVGDCTTSKKENVACSRVTFTKVICMGSIDEAGEERQVRKQKGRKVKRHGKNVVHRPR